MTVNKRNIALFAAVLALFALTALWQSWNVALSILNLSLLSAIMAVGVNIQWGYAGLFSVGVVGSVALGGLGVALVAGAPVVGAWEAGTPRIFAALAFAVAVIAAVITLRRRLPDSRLRAALVITLIVAGFFAYRWLLDPAVAGVEGNNSAKAGNIGGLGLNSLWAWPVGALFAALAAWAIGKVALGLREDYLAIATLGIAEIVITILRNEDWLARGVKNMSGLPRPWPVPQELDLQASQTFIETAASLGSDPVTASTITIKLLYAGLFTTVLLLLIWGCERAINSPWGRMVRAIRDNEVAAAAMGKDVTFRHLQIFVIGSAVVGFAGAMMTSLDGLLVPTTYTPLRFTFLIWVMVIVGGSGNNWGAVLGGLLIGWLYLSVEFLGPQMMALLSGGVSTAAQSLLPQETLDWLHSVLPLNNIQARLTEMAAHMRLVSLGLFMLLVLRFAPRGLIPEK